MRTAFRLRSLFRPLYEFLFPPACPACGAPPDTPGEMVCSRCRSTVREVHEADPLFRESLAAVTRSGAVADLAVLWYFDRDGTVQTLLHGLKYGGLTRLGMMLGERLGRRLLERMPDLRSGILVPVPLHRAKERERGYNQSVWICRGIAAATGSPVDTGLLRRVRYTRSQTGLHIDARRRNVRDAFAPHPSAPRTLGGRTVILVDDVITTGSTMESCAGVLAARGAGHIVACAVALASRPPVS